MHKFRKFRKSAHTHTFRTQIQKIHTYKCAYIHTFRAQIQKTQQIHAYKCAYIQSTILENSANPRIQVHIHSEKFQTHHHIHRTRDFQNSYNIEELILKLFKDVESRILLHLALVTWQRWKVALSLAHQMIKSSMMIVPSGNTSLNCITSRELRAAIIMAASLWRCSRAWALRPLLSTLAALLAALELSSRSSTTSPKLRSIFVARLGLQ